MYHARWDDVTTPQVGNAVYGTTSQAQDSIGRVGTGDFGDRPSMGATSTWIDQVYGSSSSDCLKVKQPFDPFVGRTKDEISPHMQRVIGTQLLSEFQGREHEMKYFGVHFAHIEPRDRTHIDAHKVQTSLSREPTAFSFAKRNNVGVFSYHEGPLSDEDVAKIGAFHSLCKEKNFDFHIVTDASQHRTHLSDVPLLHLSELPDVDAQLRQSGEYSIYDRIDAYKVEILVFASRLYEYIVVTDYRQPNPFDYNCLREYVEDPSKGPFKTIELNRLENAFYMTKGWYKNAIAQYKSDLYRFYKETKFTDGRTRRFQTYAFKSVVVLAIYIEVERMNIHLSDTLRKEMWKWCILMEDQPRFYTSREIKEKPPF